MALKKSDLYSSLWKSCDELRGGMDASQYKDYVLTLLFVKYVSDKYANDPYGLVTIPPGGSFADIVRLKGDIEIGDRINKVIRKLAAENDLADVLGVVDFNDAGKLGDGQAMVDRLTKLVAIFEGLDLHANRTDGDDLLGDAYEYLMRNFATESGKSKGQFYTPAEVSRVMGKLLGIGPHTRQDQSAYDPTGGSGSLILKVNDEAPLGLTLYLQEMDHTTAALARMNMILHGLPTAEVWRGNTLAAPHWKNPDGSLKLHDYIVANFPFSQKNWMNGVNVAHDPYGRFELGIPPAKNGDYAFLLHIVKSLKSTGRAAVILPHGVLFRGNAEATIRRKIIERRLILGIIGLPPNLFFGTGIPAAIIVIDKSGAASRSGIFMIDASKGFRKDGAKNRLRSQDIHRIVDIFSRRTELPSEGIPRYARLVPWSEIEANDYNLNIPRYVDASDPEDRHDLDAHLNGGVPQPDVDAFAAVWEVLPGLCAELFAAGPRPGYLALRHPAHALKPVIVAHPDMARLTARVHGLTAAWQTAHRPALVAFAHNGNPKALIHTLAEDLLARFRTAPLLDAYDLYQHLMDYWDATLQDDLYAIAADGWQSAARLRRLLKQDDGSKETPDLTVDKVKYRAELIPPALLIARHFAADQAALDALQAQAEAAAQEVQTFLEECSGEDDPLEEVRDSKGKVTQARIKARLKALAAPELSDHDPDADSEERTALLRLQGLMDAASAAAKAHNDAQTALDRAVVARYAVLTEDEIKTLVIDDKWFAAVVAAVQGELDRLTQTLAGRLQALDARYRDPLPALVAQTADLAARVDAHLHAMGLSWERVA